MTRNKQKTKKSSRHSSKPSHSHSRKSFQKKRDHHSSRQNEHHSRHSSQERTSSHPGKELPQRLLATVAKNRRGFAFLCFDGKEFEDLFLPESDAVNYFHGDRVEVMLTSRGEVKSFKLIQHRFTELVGKFFPSSAADRRRVGIVVYERGNSREEVWIEEKLPAPAKAGDWVRAKLSFPDGEFQFGRVTALVQEVYGPELPARADIPLIAGEFNLMEGHSEASVNEARSYRLEITPELLKAREDFRKIPLITIDGENARDFDDAVYVEKQGKNYLLWVAIADVSHYVREGTSLDRESRARGTSVYFPERAFHMLPKELSENLCSLRPHEPRLAMVSRILIDSNGKKLKTEIFNAVIESQRRATYTEIQNEWEESQKNKTEFPYSIHFELFKILNQARSARGSLDFELPETEIWVDENAEPTQIVNRKRLAAHRLIEEFMIAANEAVTEWILERHWPFVYRIHEEPSVFALEKFKKLAQGLGIPVVLDTNEITPELISDIMERLREHPAQAVLHSALLRAMKQAIYSATHHGHFGLASEAYTHFTSPIRRYPDLIVHRMLKMALETEHGHKPKPAESKLNEIEGELEKISEHCSYRERLAAEAERESHRIKQVRLMKRHLGDELQGKIVGLTKNGFFVSLDQPFVEGFVSKETIGDDFYEFNEDRMILVGKRKKRMFQVSDRVEVRVVRADLDRREIDFALLKQLK